MNIRRLGLPSSAHSPSKTIPALGFSSKNALKIHKNQMAHPTLGTFLFQEIHCGDVKNSKQNLQDSKEPIWEERSNFMWKNWGEKNHAISTDASQIKMPIFFKWPSPNSGRFYDLNRTQWAMSQLAWCLMLRGAHQWQCEVEVGRHHLLAGEFYRAQGVPVVLCRYTG